MLARARREYAAAAAWWRLNRQAAPNMLRNEMLAARTLLAKFPEAGEVDEGQGGEVRRLLLRGSSLLRLLSGEPRRAPYRDPRGVARAAAATVGVIGAES